MPMLDCDDARIPGARDGCCVVITGVVDDNDFIVDARVFCRDVQGVERRADQGRFIVRRNDEGDHRAIMSDA